MLPFYRFYKNDCLSLSAGVSYGCMDCGHNALSFRLDLVWWILNVGIEFGS
mgnify:CR=1 FL=1